MCVFCPCLRNSSCVFFILVGHSCYGSIFLECILVINLFLTEYSKSYWMSCSRLSYKFVFHLRQFLSFSSENSAPILWRSPCQYIWKWVFWSLLYPYEETQEQTVPGSVLEMSAFLIIAALWDTWARIMSAELFWFLAHRNYDTYVCCILLFSVTKLWRNLLVTTVVLQVLLLILYLVFIAS